MVAKEIPARNSTDQDSSYEEEETLSLCDLPINNHSDTFKWEDGYFSSSSKKYQSSNSLENDDDYDEEDNFFEFFSEDFTAATYPNPKEIIFCGKLIPLAGKEQVSHEENVLEPNGKTRRKRSIFHYLKPKSNDKALPLPTKTTKKCSYDNGLNLSLVGSPAVKPRWNLFMFGMVRAPSTKMGLRDMKNRQSRRRRSHSATMFPSFDDNAKTNEETTTGNVSPKLRRKSGNGFWGLFKALRCRSRHAEVVAEAAYGCSPRDERRV